MRVFMTAVYYLLLIAIAEAGKGATTPTTAVPTTDDPEPPMDEEAILKDYDRKSRPKIKEHLNLLEDARRKQHGRRRFQPPEVLGKGHFAVYDCGHEDSRHVPIDLHEPETCLTATTAYHDPVNITVEVLMLNNRLTLNAYQCQMFITREVSKCGFTSLHYGSVFSVLDQPHHISAPDCRNLVKTRRMYFERQKIFVDKFNVPFYFSYYSHGDLDADHNCQSTNFYSNGKKYTNSYEFTILRVRVALVKGTHDPNTGRVVFSNGLVANYKDQTITDSELGIFVWDAKTLPCKKKVTHSYEGRALLYSLRNSTMVGNTGDIVLIEDHKEDRFAGIVLKEHASVCERNSFKTQLPNVRLAIHNVPGVPMLNVSAVHVDDLTMTQLQSNLAYVHLRRSLTNNEKLAETHSLICENERRFLFSQLSIVANDNDAVLLSLYGPGHMVTKAGAAAYVTSCVPVMATLRTDINCTQEIPVTVGNESLYADPLTFTLRRYPIKVPCDVITPIRWRINNQWFCATPEASLCLAPDQLEPVTDDQFQVDSDITQGLGSGLFTASQFSRHRAYIELLNTRAAVVYKQTTTAIYNAATSGVLSLYDAYDYDRMKTAIAMALIPFFSIFGESWATIMGFCFIAAVVKTFLDWFVRAYIAYRRKGCGWWILASLWETLFFLLLMPWRFISFMTDRKDKPNTHDKLRELYDDDDDDDQDGARLRESIPLFGRLFRNRKKEARVERYAARLIMLNRALENMESRQLRLQEEQNRLESAMPSVSEPASQLEADISEPERGRLSRARQRYEDLTRQLESIRRSQQQLIDQMDELHAEREASKASEEQGASAPTAKLGYLMQPDNPSSAMESRF